MFKIIISASQIYNNSYDLFYYVIRIQICIYDITKR